MKKINLFVPGRMGIVGEFSDLVTPYLKDNKRLIPGSAIAISINRGIYATVSKSRKIFIKFNENELDISLDKNELEERARNPKDFFSYICGTILYMKMNYKVLGLNLEIYKSDLPIKKGLSSSAAICILIVEAFNQIYNLKMTKDEQIEAAYQGEHLALSNCGKLDQITILETGLIKIVFAEKRAIVTPIKLKKKMYFIIADLGAKKDTVKIIDDLSNCFPFPKNRMEKKIQRIMTVKNKKIVDNVEKSIENGNLKMVGRNLIKFQKNKDKCSMICSEFIAPKLHLLLNDKKIKKLSYGAKDVGSGGDGSIEILAKNEECMLQICKYLESKYSLKSICIIIDNSY